MGEFNAGKWIIGLMLYFGIFFFTVNACIGGLNAYGISTDNMQFADTGFAGDNPEDDSPVAYNASSEVSMSSVTSTLSLITGIGASNVDIGLPSAAVYIFSFLFFWIEAFMLVWAIYMAIPFIH